MEATPNAYRADIENTRKHIALIDAGDLLGETVEQAQERRALLVRQLAGLERSLARVAPLWAAAPADGAGTRLD